MAPGFSKDSLVGVINGIAVSKVCKTAGQTHWMDSMMIADGHFNLFQGVSVGMYGLIYAFYFPTQNDIIQHN